MASVAKIGVRRIPGALKRKTHEDRLATDPLLHRRDPERSVNGPRCSCADLFGKTFMKPLLIILSSILLCGCRKSKNTVTHPRESVTNFDDVIATNLTKIKIRSEPWFTVVIDGCQYIMLVGGGTLTHKGNCTNAIHHWNTEERKK